MPRYRLTLEYDGGPYRGSQTQGDLPTVQASVERAILAFCGEAVRLQAAGRTDTGVHAAGQVIHADLAKDWPPQVVMNAINAHLVPEPIAVLDAQVAEGDWHARFSATTRRYEYRILNRPADKDELAGGLQYLAAFKQKFAGEKAEQKAWQSYCRVLLSSNDFVYLD